jgi:hypothetical protein
MDKHGYLPRICAVHEAAGLLLKERVALPSASIGKNWPCNFVNRQPQLKSKYTQNYNYQRAQYKDPEKLRDWFQLVGNMICKYSIISDDIYNFDKVGYTIGLVGTTCVVTSSDRHGRPVTIQPGDRE